MEVTMENVRKLQNIFEEAWKRIIQGYRPVCVDCNPDRGSVPDGDFWTIYMNFLDCTIVEYDDLLENFDEMVNFGSLVKESVCLKDPCDDSSFILVPKGLAEKSLVLGTLV